MSQIRGLLTLAILASWRSSHSQRLPQRPTASRSSAAGARRSRSRIGRLVHGRALEGDPVLVQLVLDLSDADIEHLGGVCGASGARLEGRENGVALDLAHRRARNPYAGARG